MLQPIDHFVFQPGSVLYEAGGRGDYLYSIRRGLIKLLHVARDGTQRIVRIMGPGATVGLEMLDGERVSYIHVSDKNANRLPDYQRLDISASRMFESDHWKTEVGLSLFNLYNHKNIWYREYNLDTTPVTITDAVMLGFTPTVFVNINLK